MQHLPVIVVLVDLKRRLELPTSVPRHHRTAMDRDTEATLSVHESHHPIGIEHDVNIGGFLLIVRTGRIVTVHGTTLWRGCDTDEYRRILGCSSIWWGFSTAKLKLHRYSYGRRLPGLRFRASPPKGLTLPRNLPAPGRRQSVYIVLRLGTLLCF